MANGAPGSLPAETPKPKALKGALPVYRRELLLLREKKLKDLTEFGAWVVFLLTADWDKKHPRFGCIPSAAEIARLIQVDPSTIQRHRQALHERGLLRKRSDGEFEIFRFWKYGRMRDLANPALVTLQEENAFLRFADAHTQGRDARMHEPNHQSSDEGATENGSLLGKSDDRRASLHDGYSPKEPLKNLRETRKKELAASQPSSLILARRDSSLLEEKDATPCDSCGRRIVSPFIREITSRQCGRSLCTGCYVGSKTQSGTPVQDSKP